jgi:hypothetical protein
MKCVFYKYLEYDFLQEQGSILNVVKLMHEKCDVTFNPVPVGSFDMV